MIKYPKKLFSKEANKNIGITSSILKRFFYQPMLFAVQRGLSDDLSQEVYRIGLEACSLSCEKDVLRFANHELKMFFKHNLTLRESRSGGTYKRFMGEIPITCLEEVQQIY